MALSFRDRFLVSAVAFAMLTARGQNIEIRLQSGVPLAVPVSLEISKSVEDTFSDEAIGYATSSTLLAFQLHALANEDRKRTNNLFFWDEKDKAKLADKTFKILLTTLADPKFARVDRKVFEKASVGTYFNYEADKAGGEVVAFILIERILADPDGHLNPDAALDIAFPFAGILEGPVRLALEADKIDAVLQRNLAAQNLVSRAPLCGIQFVERLKRSKRWHELPPELRLTLIQRQQVIQQELDEDAKLRI